jgi:hypothetical protein
MNSVQNRPFACECVDLLVYLLHTHMRHVTGKSELMALQGSNHGLVEMILSASDLRLVRKASSNCPYVFERNRSGGGLRQCCLSKATKVTFKLVLCP